MLAAVVCGPANRRTLYGVVSAAPTVPASQLGYPPRSVPFQSTPLPSDIWPICRPPLPVGIETACEQHVCSVLSLQQ